MANVQTVETILRGAALYAAAGAIFAAAFLALGLPRRVSIAALTREPKPDTLPPSNAPPSIHRMSR